MFLRLKVIDNVEETTVCEKIDAETLAYKSRVPAKGWNIETKTVFTHVGITSYIMNVDKNITTSKSYTRVAPTAAAPQAAV